MPDLDLRPVSPDEVDAHAAATAAAFYKELHPSRRELWRAECEPERTLDAFADGEIVATSGLITRELTVPGATVPMAGVTSVGVRADHRRQGLFDRMMRAQLAAIQERGTEAVAALWPSEGTLYERYGFGCAVRTADLTVRSPDARLRPSAGALERPRLADPAAVRAELAAIHDAVRRQRPGMLARGPAQWDVELFDPEHERGERSRLQAALLDDGYVLFAVRKDTADTGPSPRVVELHELLASRPESAAALWSFVLGLDLTRSVAWDAAPADEPLVHLLTDPRAVEEIPYDTLWVRLVDVARALAQRTYATPLDVVLEVEDDVCPHNAGRLRLAGDATGARCERTSDPADLALTAVELGAAYLGGTSLAVLAAAGRVRERTPGAVVAADRALRGAREPWCPDQF
jgi:predicted acetyltransferase